MQQWCDQCAMHCDDDDGDKTNVSDDITNFTFVAMILCMNGLYWFIRCLEHLVRSRKETSRKKSE